MIGDRLVSLKSVSDIFQISTRLSSPPKHQFCFNEHEYFYSFEPDARKRPLEEKSNALTHPE
jgi:hypothetical protein